MCSVIPHNPIDCAVLYSVTPYIVCIVLYTVKPGGPAFLAHTKQKVTNIVGLTALRLAFFIGYE